VAVSPGSPVAATENPPQAMASLTGVMMVMASLTGMMVMASPTMADSPLVRATMADSLMARATMAAFTLGKDMVAMTMMATAPPTVDLTMAMTDATATVSSSPAATIGSSSTGLGVQTLLVLRLFSSSITSTSARPVINVRIYFPTCSLQ
jgi:hypothetical protein